MNIFPWPKINNNYNSMQVPGTQWTDEEKVMIKKPLLELAYFIIKKYQANMFRPIDGLLQGQVNYTWCWK